MKRSLSYYLFWVILFITSSVSAQVTKRVLFLGNSYTAANNLPALISDVAASTGNQLIYESNTPGGYYLGQHFTNTLSLSLIEQGNWDNVVLQEQSLALAYPYYYMYGIPSSLKLDSTIKANNDCAQTLFYSTWGRKNGDSYFCTQPICAIDTFITRTYFQMDSTIESHYKVFADSMRAGMSPVGGVWRYIRQHFPSIELFTADESHPTEAGSYAAACCFYAIIFRKDPTQITFNSSLSATDANNIKLAAKLVAYDHLSHWNIGPFDHLLNNQCHPPANNNDQYWYVSPNPVRNNLFINFPASNVNDTIRIYNAQGILIKEIELTASSSIDFNTFASGVYLVRSMNKGLTLKIMKL